MSGDQDAKNAKAASNAAMVRHDPLHWSCRGLVPLRVFVLATCFRRQWGLFLPMLKADGVGYRGG